MAGLRQNPLSVIFLGALSLLIFLFAAVQVSRYSRFANVQYWARQIEKGKVVEAETLNRLVRETNELGIENECQSAFTKPFLTILLTNMDKQNPSLEYENWFQALQHTEAFLQHALSCLPTDGNLWARYAMIRQASAEQANEIYQLVSRSQRYSPAEENTISARYFLYNRLTDASLKAISKQIYNDMVIICSVSAKQLRSRLPAPNSRLGKIIEQTALGCPIIGYLKAEPKVGLRTSQNVF